MYAYFITAFRTKGIKTEIPEKNESETEDKV